MKNLLILFSLILFSSSAFSQITKGQWLAGGLAEIAYTQFSTTSTPNISNDLAFKISPDVGYFIFDGFALGVRTSFYKDYYEQPSMSFVTSGYKTNMTQVTGALFVRYYFLPTDSKINLLVDGGAGFGYAEQSTTYTGTNPPNGYSNSSNMQNIFLSGGPVVFLNPNTALEFLVSYNRINVSSNYQTVVFFGVGFQIHLGKGILQEGIKNKAMRPLRD